MAENTVEIIEQPVKVSIENNNVSINVNEDKLTVVIGETGPQGPKGDAGGLDISDISYVHTQNSASSTWVINHNLSFVPGITVVDSAGSVVEGSYEYPNSTTVVANFSGAFSGKAYLS